MSLSARSTPTGPGSRGGMWHDPGHRKAYYRAWRAAHPEYREREALRAARKRAADRGLDPVSVVAPNSFPRPLPVVALTCPCPHCRCQNEVPVVACGFCLTGDHEEAS